MRDIKTILASLSNHPGVYQMLGEDGVVLYVGKAKDLKKRVSSYFSSKMKDPKTQLLVKHIKNIHVTITHTENDAYLLECNLIKKLKPRYNVLLRDDKSYPYILISDHLFPRIDIYRGQRKKQGRYFGPYPSSLAVRETINLLQKLFQLRTCRDSYFEARSRPCLLYQIGRCTAPCVAFVTDEEYKKQVALAVLFLEGKSDQVVEVLQRQMERASEQKNYEVAAQFRDQINRLRQIQDKQYIDSGHRDMDVVGYASQGGVTCINVLTVRKGQVMGSQAYYPTVPLYSEKNEILSSFLAQYYVNHPVHGEHIPGEIVIDVKLDEGSALETMLSVQSGAKISILKPARGEKVKILAMAAASARQSLLTHLAHKLQFKDRFISLKSALNLEIIPRRLECYDISHSMGEATVASCVVCNQDGLLKSDYRRFNITGITPGDDVAAMHQVISRRFKQADNKEAVFPDIAFIDGGRTQLAAANKALQTLGVADVLLVGVSKGPGRKAGFETLHRLGMQPVHLPADSPALHLIQQIRDEAHRFAITGHRQRRDKARTRSALESIPGIGAKRRRDLLRYFGGIQGVAHASLDELLKVQGVSRSLAERIYAAFHDTTL